MLTSVQTPHSLEQSRAWQAWRLACGSAQLARMAGSGEQAVHVNVRCTLECVVRGRQSAPNGHQTRMPQHSVCGLATVSSVPTAPDHPLPVLKMHDRMGKHLAWRAAA